MSASPGPEQQADWVVVVPVKALHAAKSRVALPQQMRAELAAAITIDTVTAALTCPVVLDVLVVAEEPADARHLAELGATVLAQGTPGVPLDDVARQGAREAASRHPGARLAVLAGDLPALREEHLTEALLASRSWASTFVADRPRTGTTLLTASDPLQLAPSYGPGSAQRHANAGAVPIPAADALRCDVDTLADLGAAVVLGVGRATSHMMERLPALQ